MMNLKNKIKKKPKQDHSAEIATPILPNNNPRLPEIVIRFESRSKPN